MADNPIHIPAVFAVNGLKNVIQKVRQVGQAIQDFTWVDGTPAVTMIDKADGGLAPKGQDFNGVLNALSEHTVFNQNGGRYKWSQEVIDNYGGYSKDFIIQSDNGVTEFISLVDNNTRNPNNSLGSDWKIYAGQGSIPDASSTTAGIARVLNVLNSDDVASALSAAQGKALNDKMLGVGQTWQDVTSSRSSGVTYTNNTGRPIQISICVKDSGVVSPFSLIIGGVTVFGVDDFNVNQYVSLDKVIPIGVTYRVNAGNNVISIWSELR